MNTVDRQSGLWHLNNLDPQTLAVRFVDGESRLLERKDVVEILGLNGGTREVPVVNPGEREVLVRRVLVLLGEDERKPGGLTIKMLREFLDKPCPFHITKAYITKVKICYTLLALSCFVAPRYANLTISEEAMYVVLNPDRIGQYDFASYALQVLRESAQRARKDQEEGSMTILAGGCNALLEVIGAIIFSFCTTTGYLVETDKMKIKICTIWNSIGGGPDIVFWFNYETIVLVLTQVFSFDRLAIPELDEWRHVSPRIAAYSGHYLRDLIKGETTETDEGKMYGKTSVSKSPLTCSPGGKKFTLWLVRKET
jgi:hypothetical protein